MPCSGFGHPEPVEVPSVTVHMGGPGSESHQGNGAVSGLQEDCGIWAVPALSPGLLTRAIQLAQEGLFPGRNFQTFLCKVSTADLSPRGVLPQKPCKARCPGRGSDTLLLQCHFGPGI